MPGTASPSNDQEWAYETVTRGGGKQPPKKKHAKKPRKREIEPLSQDDKEILAAEAVQKAKIHFQEAENMADWGKAPQACTHSAYYAMHFYAVAALYKAGGVGKAGDVPKSHEHVIQHYIKLAESKTGYLQTSGMILNRARDDRMRADYFTNATWGWAEGMQGVSPADAADATAAAREFMTAWDEEWLRDPLET